MIWIVPNTESLLYLKMSRHVHPGLVLHILLTPRCHTRWRWCTDGGNATPLKCFQFGRFQWESVRFSTFEARLLDYNGYRVNCLHSCCLVIFWHRVKVKPVASSQLLQDWHLAGFSFPVCGLQCNTLPRRWNEETYSKRQWNNNKRMQCHKGNIDSHWFDCKPKAVYHAAGTVFVFVQVNAKCQAFIVLPHLLPKTAGINSCNPQCWTSCDRKMSGWLFFFLSSHYLFVFCQRCKWDKCNRI